MGLSNRQNACLLVTVGLILLVPKIWSGDSQRYSSSTSYSHRALGVSSLLEFLRRVNPDRVVVTRKAVLDEHELKRDDVFLALSPKSPFSSREARILKGFVERGGHLIISTESPQTSENVRELIDEFGWSESREEVPVFVNQSTILQAVPVEHGPLPQNVALEFYSRYGFPSEGGVKYVREEKVGDGTVTLLTGVPIYSNAMIGRGENWRAAHRLATLPGRVIFDEYHHLFSDKSVGDLLREPFFAIPVFGAVLVAVLFFAFGRLGRRDAWGEPPPAPAVRSFHDFGSGVFQGLARQSRAPDLGLREHAAFLKSIFPDESGRIDQSVGEKGPWLTRGSALIELHKALLRERGWRL